jgi:uncharacterized protein (TIGR02452 family)
MDPPRASGRSGNHRGGHWQDPDEQNRFRRIAEETVDICKHGTYRTRSHGRMDIGARVRACIDRSILYRPDRMFELPPRPEYPGFVEVREETVFTAVLRLRMDHRDKEIAILNFASACKPGGGFLNGRQAQEEAIARASALYPSIERHREMYEFGEADTNPLYTDYMIYSPHVPFFRDDSGELIEYPFEVSVITAAAPNAKECTKTALRRALRQTMKNRLRKVIHLAITHGNRVLVLGAFGCGVFGNDPMEVATIEKELLMDEKLGLYFDLIANPIAPARTNRSNFEAFKRVFPDYT